ncbi:hypothetical protein BGZ95_001454 [Linnemannia exigua]|uniref:Uncharacterized protein n=1 Tax=Linnemannia exigua TaxID=604196 RepID=A0AAD4H3M6_9FUNG|nr:hypothetical protein BGZ95_001454 [Linnemannia exigua]
MSYALIADRILQQHAKGIHGGGEGEEDSAIVDAVLAAGGESAPLRKLYRVIKLAKTQQRNADTSDDSVQRQRSRMARKRTSTDHRWSHSSSNRAVVYASLESTLPATFGSNRSLVSRGRVAVAEGHLGAV